VQGYENQMIQSLKTGSGGSSVIPSLKGGNVTMTGPNGTFTVPQDQVNTMKQNGYTQQ
jgi:hypothetical protein